MKRFGGGTLSRFYYLKDHLGSIRATVKAGDTLVTDGFDATLAQWTTVKGCCFTVGSSALSNTATPGAESILITSSSVTTDDGLLSSTVSYTGPVSTGAPCLVFRYQDVSNFSYVSPGASNLAVVERISGTDYTRASVSLSMSSGTAYRFEVSFRGSTVTVKRDGAVVLASSALTRLSSGKAGVRVSRSYSGSSSWRDVTVVKTGVDQIASYDDFYPYGQVIEGRSFNAGLSDARYKYTEKERDVETGYDYFGARYYDERIGRFLTVDRFAEKYSFQSPYSYAACNPVRYIDVNGDSIWVEDRGERFLYSEDAKYGGKNKTIQRIVAALRKINGMSAGAKVLGSLVGSTANYAVNVVNDLPEKDQAGAFRPNEEGGGTLAMSEKALNAGSIGHEAFHAYQFENGNTGASIVNEVEAYLFGAAMSGNRDFGNSPFNTGGSYQTFMTRLLVEWDGATFYDAARSFLDGSQANRYGTYNKFAFELNESSGGQRTLIDAVYPLVKKRR